MLSSGVRMLSSICPMRASLRGGNLAVKPSQINARNCERAPIQAFLFPAPKAPSRTAHVPEMAGACSASTFESCDALLRMRNDGATP